MDSTVLDPESFNAKKELAEIQTQIATGRAVLADLKNETGAYLTEREQEVIKRIDEVLARSEADVRAIGENRDALQRYASEVTSMAADLQVILLLFKEVRAKQAEVAGLDEKRLERKAEQLAQWETDLEVLKSGIETDRKGITADRKWIGEEELRLRGERELLERTATRLKEGKL